MLEKIRTLAKEKGVTLAEVERSCGLGERSLSKWDKSIPAVDKAKRVADYLGTTVDDLLNDGGE